MEKLEEQRKEELENLDEQRKQEKEKLKIKGKKIWRNYFKKIYNQNENFSKDVKRLEREIKTNHQNIKK